MRLRYYLQYTNSPPWLGTTIDKFSEKREDPFDGDSTTSYRHYLLSGADNSYHQGLFLAALSFTLYLPALFITLFG